MSDETRGKRRRMRKQDDPEPCGAWHNPGYWPYVAACVRIGPHFGQHIDRDGNTWITSKIIKE